MATKNDLKNMKGDLDDLKNMKNVDKDCLKAGHKQTKWQCWAMFCVLWIYCLYSLYAIWGSIQSLILSGGVLNPTSVQDPKHPLDPKKTINVWARNSFLAQVVDFSYLLWTLVSCAFAALLSWKLWSHQKKQGAGEDFSTVKKLALTVAVLQICVCAGIGVLVAIFAKMAYSPYPIGMFAYIRFYLPQAFVPLLCGAVIYMQAHEGPDGGDEETGDGYGATS